MRSAAIVVLGAGLAWAASADAAVLPRVTIDYPEEGSLFPPEIAAPTFLWRDASGNATAWLIEVKFTDGSPGIRVQALGERLRIGEIDPRCVSSTNELPALTPQQAAARTWIPDAAVWSEIKKHSVEHTATVIVSGYRDRKLRHAVSRGSVAIQTSKDPAGAPIFYRDVPLMPSEAEKGVIKPLAPAAIPLIAWRLRDIAEPRGSVVLEGMHTCANCHSFSADGKTLGMDLDGPQNDKGLYAIAAVQPRMSIRNEDMITWKSFRDRPSRPDAGRLHVAHLAGRAVRRHHRRRGAGLEPQLLRGQFQGLPLSPGVLSDARGPDGLRPDYRRAANPCRARTIPATCRRTASGARTANTWCLPGPKERTPTRRARRWPNSPTIPTRPRSSTTSTAFPSTAARAGRAEPIAGASHNGMSNRFPRVSPDGRWIVFVKARNGQFMRPDSQLYIVPAAGGEARRMRCNTPLMNSWHSFSPNGRWLVFSSKARSPYTQMYLTHIDEEGNDSPAILIENSTAANRAVNLPEFVNIPAGGLAKIEVPAAEFYARFDRAWELSQKGQFAAAIAAWRSALELNPEDARANNNLGFALAREGKLAESIACWERALQSNDQLPEVRQNLVGALENVGVAWLRKGSLEEAMPLLRRAVELNPQDAGSQYNLGLALLRKGSIDEAIARFQTALALAPRDAQAHNDLAVALTQKRQFAQAAAQFREAIGIDPQFAQAHANLAWLLATSPEAAIRNGSEALRWAAKAVDLSRGKDASMLDALAAAYAEAGRFQEAVETARRAIDVALPPLIPALKARLAMYERKQPFRER